MSLLPYNHHFQLFYPLPLLPALPFSSPPGLTPPSCKLDEWTTHLRIKLVFRANSSQKDQSLIPKRSIPVRHTILLHA